LAICSHFQINAIVANLPKERQTLLFSATQTRNDPVFVSAHERCAHATPDNLTQWYMVCEEQDKVNTMWSFIVNHKKSKIIIFVSSCKQLCSLSLQARFLTGAFCHLRPGLPVMGLWGTMNQKKRVDVFQKFENKEAAVMIATDVASRGLDFSDVDWVIQVDCPASVEDYIHRVGRTARMNQAGHAVLFLTPSQEEGMITALRQANIPLEKQTVDPKALVDIRVKMQAVLSQFPELNQHAQKSLVAYLRSIYLMKNKRIFDVSSINAAELASSYGLMTVPRDSKTNKAETPQTSGSTTHSDDDRKNK
ncbi:helicase protein, partial [Oesophagostomum dentatum]